MYLSFLKAEISTQHFQNLQVSSLQKPLTHGIGEACSAVILEQHYSEWKNESVTLNSL